MASLRFNRSQLTKPTPAGAVFWIRIYTVVMGIVLGWMQTVAWIPSTVQGPISSIIGLTVAIANAILPFIAVETNGKSVPIDKVTAMEEPDKKP